jgi:hypothetical protein
MDALAGEKAQKEQATMLTQKGDLVNAKLNPTDGTNGPLGKPDPGNVWKCDPQTNMAQQYNTTTKTFVGDKVPLNVQVEKPIDVTISNRVPGTPVK